MYPCDQAARPILGSGSIKRNMKATLRLVSPPKKRCGMVKLELFGWFY